eukprot:483610-Pelagomonas_calceolata.AAC.2
MAELAPAPVLHLHLQTSAHTLKALERTNAMQNSYGQIEEMHKCMQDGGVECTVKGVKTTIPNTPSTQLSNIPDSTTSP